MSGKIPVIASIIGMAWRFKRALALFGGSCELFRRAGRLASFPEQRVAVRDCALITDCGAGHYSPESWYFVDVRASISRSSMSATSLTGGIGFCDSHHESTSIVAPVEHAKCSSSGSQFA